MRHLVIVAAVGAFALLTPLHAHVTASPSGDASHPAVIYAVDNPAQPDDAFPQGPFSGGTD